MGAHRRLLKRLRRIEAFLAEWGPALAMSNRSASIAQALLRAEGTHSPWRPSLLLATERWQWELLQDVAKSETTESARLARLARRESWYAFCADSLQSGGGKVFRWVREGSRSLRAPEGHDWQAG